MGRRNRERIETTQFKESFMRTIPKKLATDITITDQAADTRLVDLKQRNILKNIKDLYRAKGYRRGHEIFFRIKIYTSTVVSHLSRHPT